MQLDWITVTMHLGVLTVRNMAGVSHIINVPHQVSQSHGSKEELLGKNQVWKDAIRKGTYEQKG